MMTAPASRQSYVTCRAAGELLALDVAVVERVLRFTEPRTLPNSAPWLRGVIEVGGQLLPVLDLRGRLGVPGADADDASRIVVLALTSGRIDCVRGMLRRESRLYIALDAGHLVTSQERLALDAAVEESQHG